MHWYRHTGIPVASAGTRIIYDRKFLLDCRNSPIARTPPCCLPQIPGVTMPSLHPLSKLQELKEELEEEKDLAGKFRRQIPATTLFFLSDHSFNVLFETHLQPSNQNVLSVFSPIHVLAQKMTASSRWTCELRFQPPMVGVFSVWCLSGSLWISRHFFMTFFCCNQKRAR